MPHLTANVTTLERGSRNCRCRVTALVPLSRSKQYLGRGGYSHGKIVREGPGRCRRRGPRERENKVEDEREQVKDGK